MDKRWQIPAVWDIDPYPLFPALSGQISWPGKPNRGRFIAKTGVNTIILKGNNIIYICIRNETKDISMGSTQFLFI